MRMPNMKTDNINCVNNNVGLGISLNSISYHVFNINEIEQ